MLTCQARTSPVWRSQSSWGCLWGWDAQGSTEERPASPRERGGRGRPCSEPGLATPLRPRRQRSRRQSPAGPEGSGSSSVLLEGPTRGAARSRPEPEGIPFFGFREAAVTVPRRAAGRDTGEGVPSGSKGTSPHGRSRCRHLCSPRSRELHRPCCISRQRCGSVHSSESFPPRNPSAPPGSSCPALPPSRRHPPPRGAPGARSNGSRELRALNKSSAHTIQGQKINIDTLDDFSQFVFSSTAGAKFHFSDILDAWLIETNKAKASVHNGRGASIVGGR